MALSHRLIEYSKNIEGIQQWPFKALAGALEIIPKILATNCGTDVVRTMTELRAKHSKPDGTFYGIDGNTGKIADMREADVWDPVAVKIQTLKTSIECAGMILRIDDIVSGIKKRDAPASGRYVSDEEPDETFGDARDG